MRFPLRELISSPAAFFLSSMILWGCVLGGTGTDTENGVKDPAKSNVLGASGVSARVVDGNGSPLKGVTLQLYLPAYRPDSGVAPVSQLQDGAKSLVSDSGGYVTIPLRAAGKFVVEGISAGQVLFYDTLAVPDIKNSSLYTFRTRTVRGFQGKVKLVSGMRIDSGFVFIRGTPRHARLDAAGGYDLGALPEDVGRMAVGIRFASSPTSVLEVTEIRNVPGKDSAGTAYACKDVPKDSATRIFIPAPVGADTAKTAATALEAAKVDSALKACDSLPKGSVVNVRSPSAAMPSSTQSAGVPLLVVKDAVSIISISGTHTNPAVVIPYAECVPAAGSEMTSFDLQVQPQGAASDILVKDVADKCLAR